MAKIKELEKKVEEKANNDNMSEFDRAVRDTRSEASRTEVNVDVLFEKLILLDSVARKTGNQQKEKIAMLLSRFHVHRSRPSFVATLVLKLMSTKDEEAVLDKEQKLLKSFGIAKEEKPPVTKAPTTSTVSASANVPAAFSWPGMPYHMPPQPFFYPGGPSAYATPRPQSSGAGTRAFRPRAPSCFRCHKVGHFVKDCPM